jgi:hypothetical protein
MLNLEFKEPAAVLIVIAALALFVAILGIVPFASGFPPLALWSRIAFASLGMASLVGAWAISRSKEQKTVDPPEKAYPPIDPPDPLLLEPNFSSRRLDDYDLKFSEECRANMRSLGLGEADVIKLVDYEFRNHVNYFLYDLEDYMLPVRSGFLVFMDKTNTRIAFRGVRSCTKSEAMLASWNDVLAAYRRASRLAYRGPGNALLVLTNKAMLPTALGLHGEIDLRLRKHFSTYLDLEIMAAEAIGEPELADLQEKLRAMASRRPDRLPIAREVALHLRASRDALREAKTVAADLENSFIAEDRAVASIVTALELSLQHLHKVLSQFPPTD